MKKDNDCIFCKMAVGLIPVSKLYEDDSCICIRDIHPHAKVHLLVIPKDHFSSLEMVFPENLPENKSNLALIGHLFETATHVARMQGLIPGGFRTIINTGSDAGQTVFHLHLHILGGEPLTRLC